MFSCNVRQLAVGFYVYREVEILGFYFCLNKKSIHATSLKRRTHLHFVEIYFLGYTENIFFFIGFNFLIPPNSLVAP
jgi:hypothetical protein